MKKELMKKGVMVVRKLLKGLIRNLVCLAVGTFVIILKLILAFIKNTGRFIAGMYGIIYKVIPYYSTKVYSKMPKLVKITLVYILVVGTIIGVYSTHNVVLANNINEMNKTTIEVKENKILALINKNATLTEQNSSYAELERELKQTKVEYQAYRTISSLNNIERDIYDKAVELGLTHNQAILVVSISKHETGNWTSKAFKNKNNFGGVMCNTGLKSYDTYNDGLNGFVSLLKNRYFDKGLITIETIGAVYCPIGASNDPTGVNVHWIPNVTKYYNNYLNK